MEPGALDAGSITLAGVRMGSPDRTLLAPDVARGQRPGVVR